MRSSVIRWTEPTARTRSRLSWQQDFNALVYVLNGHGSVGTEQRPSHSGQSAVLGAGAYLTIAADVINLARFAF